MIPNSLNLTLQDDYWDEFVKGLAEYKEKIPDISDEFWDKISEILDTFVDEYRGVSDAF